MPKTPETPTPPPEETEKTEIQKTEVDLAMEKALEELAQMEIEKPEDLDALVWEKLSEIYRKFPQAMEVMSPEHKKTYKFPMMFLLNLALKYEKDDMRKELYKIFFNCSLAYHEEMTLALQNNDLNKHDELNSATYPIFTPEAIQSMQKYCQEWANYIEAQSRILKEVIGEIDFTETEGKNWAREASGGIEKLSKALSEVDNPIKKIWENYPFMRQIKCRSASNLDEPARLAGHVIGTSTMLTFNGTFIHEVVEKFTGKVENQDINNYILLHDPQIIDENLPIKMVIKMISEDTLPDAYKDKEEIPAREVIAAIKKKYQL